MRKKILLVSFVTLYSVLSSQAHALEVLSPYVVKGEFEFEQQGLVTFDRNPANNNAQDYTGALGYSPTTWWNTELESEYGRDAGSEQKLRNSSINSENTFELTEPGDYWIDTAAFFEFDMARSDQPNNVIFGLLGEKPIGMFEETANLLLHKDFGGDQGVTPLGLAYSSQTKYRLRQWFEPGFEIYGDTDGKEQFAEQQFSAGPGMFGKIPTYDGQAIKYQVAYLLGATPATPDGAFRWKLEYEFYF